MGKDKASLLLKRLKQFYEKINIDGFYDVKVAISFKPIKPLETTIQKIEVDQFNSRLEYKASLLADEIRIKLEEMMR